MQLDPLSCAVALLAFAIAAYFAFVSSRSRSANYSLIRFTLAHLIETTFSSIVLVHYNNPDRRLKDPREILGDLHSLKACAVSDDDLHLLLAKEIELFRLLESITAKNYPMYDEPIEDRSSVPYATLFNARQATFMLRNRLAEIERELTGRSTVDQKQRSPSPEPSPAGSPRSPDGPNLVQEVVYPKPCLIPNDITLTDCECYLLRAIADGGFGDNCIIIKSEILATWTIPFDL